MKRFNFAAALAFLVFATSTASALDMKCGTSLVKEGDSEYTVLRKCGEPSAFIGNRWIYDRGATRLVVVVHFSEGFVSFTELETLRR
jgi:hypothetical protein